MELTIRLHGDLQRFGTEFKLNVDRIKEGTSGLINQLKGFRKYLSKGQYQVKVQEQFINDENIYSHFEEELKEPTILHIYPVIKGAKNSGLIGVIVGAIIIIASIVSYQWYGVSYGAAMMMGMAGAAMMLGGVAMMLTPTPDMPTMKEEEKKQSTSFSNSGNLIAQGRPIPLAYGEILTGSLVISKGAKTFDVNDVSVPEVVNPKNKTTGIRGLSR